jgi:ribosomal protein S18 acetylase RimI-like enzyme
MNKVIDKNEIIEVPVPILRHEKWLKIGYPLAFNENELIQFLINHRDSFLHEANVKSVDQIKVYAPWDWKNIGKSGFSPGTVLLTQDVRKLMLTKAKQFSVISISQPESVTNLLKLQGQYHLNYMPDYFSNDIDGSVQREIKLMNEYLVNNQGIIFGIKYQGIIVAFIDIDLSTKNPEINNVFVMEKFRHQGMATSLIVHTSKALSKRKFEKISLYTGYNQDALNLYLKLGFQPEYLQWIINLDNNL